MAELLKQLDHELSHLRIAEKNAADSAHFARAYLTLIRTQINEVCGRILELRQTKDIAQDIRPHPEIS